MESLLFKFIGLRQSRPDGTSQEVPFSWGGANRARLENWRQPTGRTDFLIAWAGGDFNVPIRSDALAWLAINQGDGQTERKQNVPGLPGDPARELVGISGGLLLRSAAASSPRHRQPRHPAKANRAEWRDRNPRHWARPECEPRRQA